MASPERAHVPKAGTRTARGRLLAARLQALREERGYSRKEVNDKCGFAGTTVFRIETEETVPHDSTLTLILNLYKIEDPERAEIRELARLTRAASRGRKGVNNPTGWLHEYSDMMPDEYLDLIGFEADAAKNSTVGLLLIPGLLQTESYARAVIDGTLPGATDEEVERRVRVRMQRQGVLKRELPFQLDVILDEASLWRSVGGPDVMAEQLRALADGRPNVRIRVIPYSKGAHPGMINSFAILTFGDPGIPDLIYSETLAGDMFRDSEADLTRHWGIYRELEETALNETETAALLRSVARKHKR